LYILAFGEAKLTEEIEENMYKCKDWGKFGFQNENPRTDFRAAGILGLRQIIYFIENYPDYVEHMKRQHMFFFALNSIQITHFLVVFLHLVKDEKSCMPHLLKYKSKRNQFKNFL